MCTVIYKLRSCRGFWEIYFCENVKTFWLKQNVSCINSWFLIYLPCHQWCFSAATFNYTENLFIFSGTLIPKIIQFICKLCSYFSANIQILAHIPSPFTACTKFNAIWHFRQSIQLDVSIKRWFNVAGAHIPKTKILQFLMSNFSAMDRPDP